MKIIFFSFFLFFSNCIYSQTITVLSKENSLPIEYAHIILKEIITSKDTFLLTNEKGFVNFNIDKNYIVVISALGYHSQVDTLKLSNNLTYLLERKEITLNEVIITAQYAPNSADKAVHKIKIIDQKKIEAMGAQNLRDLLTNEMNIQIAQDNVLGSSMSLQGISGQNVKILIDGVAVTGRLNGNIDISQINMNNVERIEIIEGPLSVSYGTDALAGTINIITKKTQKKSIEGSISNYYESIGNYNSTGRIGINHKKNTIIISGGRNYFDGWRQSDKSFQIEKVRLADSLRFKDWKEKEQYFGTVYYSRYIKNLKIGYTTDYFYEQIMNRGLPRQPYNQTAFDDYYTTNRFTNSINLTGKINKHKNITLIAAYNIFQRNKNTYFKDLTTLNQDLSMNDGDQDTSTYNNFMFRGTYSTSKDSSKFNYEVGYDINHEVGRGARIESGKREIGDYAIFSSAEYAPFSKLIIRPGIRFTYNTSYKAPLIPSINIRYQVLKNITTRFSYAKGFRAPSVKELYFNFIDVNHNIVGNSALKAEKSNNYNLSINFSKTRKNILWKIDNSYFYNNIKNMISLAQITGSEFTYFNIENFQTLGTQLQTEIAWNHLKVTLGGSYIGRYNQLSNLYLSDKFTYSKEAKCNLFYEWKSKHLTFALFYKYSGRVPGFSVDENNEIFETSIDPFRIADISITKALFKQNVKLGIGSKNIFNVRNINGNNLDSSVAHSGNSNSISVGMGRSYFLRLVINLTSKQ